MKKEKYELKICPHYKEGSRCDSSNKCCEQFIAEDSKVYCTSSLYRSIYVTEEYNKLKEENEELRYLKTENEELKFVLDQVRKVVINFNSINSILDPQDELPAEDVVETISAYSEEILHIIGANDEQLQRSLGFIRGYKI